MPRGRLTFRQTDVTHAIKAARAAGIEIARIAIEPGGKIVVVAGKPVEAEAQADEFNESDTIFGLEWCLNKYGDTSKNRQWLERASRPYTENT